MKFTNCLTDDTLQKIYYKLAFRGDKFDQLSLADKYRLIVYMAKLLDPYLTVYFEDSSTDDIGRYDEDLDILYINKNKLVAHDQTYSVELYAFLYENIMKRYVKYRKLLVEQKKKVAENKVAEKKIEKIQSNDLEIILINLVFAETENLHKQHAVTELKKQPKNLPLEKFWNEGQAMLMREIEKEKTVDMEREYQGRGR